MRVTPILFALAMVGAPATARGQSEHETRNPDGNLEVSGAQTPGGAEARSVIVVVVESASRSLLPEALRRALATRLEGSLVSGLGAAEGNLRARVLVAVQDDGSAIVDVAMASDHGVTAHLPAPPTTVGGSRGEARRDAVNRLAEAVAALLTATEASAPGVRGSRHGLLPWQYSAVRRPSAGITRIDAAPLLPWPGTDPDGAGSPPTPSGPVPAASPVESAAGLAAPPPP